MAIKSDFFPCPACGQFIGWDATVCRFCTRPVDATAAAASARLQEKINRACNEASHVRNIAGFMWIAFALQFFFALIGQVLFLGLVLLGPILLIKWQINYGSLKTTDLDFDFARRNRNIAFVLLLPTPIALIVTIMAAGIGR